MNDQQLQTLQKFLDMLNSGAVSVVQSYTVWFVISALRYMALGVAFVGAGIYLSRKQLPKPEYPSDDYRWVPKYLGYLCILIGALTFFGQFADLFAPKAAAIHQLIQDVASK